MPCPKPHGPKSSNRYGGQLPGLSHDTGTYAQRPGQERVVPGKLPPPRPPQGNEVTLWAGLEGLLL